MPEKCLGARKMSACWHTLFIFPELTKLLRISISLLCIHHCCCTILLIIVCWWVDSGSYCTYLGSSLIGPLEMWLWFEIYGFQRQLLDWCVEHSSKHCLWMKARGSCWWQVNIGCCWWHQAIISADIDPDPCCHMASLGHIELDQD